ncbi:MAG: 50S ribosomal protein L22 [Candidatus Micrarchaeaceae archaeon]
MHNYTFKKSDDIAYAQAYDVNASYKDLCAVCDAIRYAKTNDAFALLDSIITKSTPIRFKQFNKHMGARHELGGAKGAYPVNAAKEIKKVLTNAVANAELKAIDTEQAIVAYATANKTHIERRLPSKGHLSWGRGMYGFSSRVHSDIEYAKIEMAIALPEAVGRTPRRIKIVKKKEVKQQTENKKEKQQKQQQQKQQQPQQKQQETASTELKQVQTDNKETKSDSDSKAVNLNAQM